MKFSISLSVMVAWLSFFSRFFVSSIFFLLIASRGTLAPGKSVFPAYGVISVFFEFSAFGSSIVASGDFFVVSTAKSSNFNAFSGWNGSAAFTTVFVTAGYFRADISLKVYSNCPSPVLM